MAKTEHERRTRGVMFGLLLVGLGVTILVTNAGWVPWMTWTRWWPWITIVIGLAELVTARRAKEVGGGTLLMMLGGWFLVAVNGWYGLRWYNSWPLALVAIGMSMVFEWIASRFMNGREEGSMEVRHDA